MKLTQLLIASALTASALAASVTASMTTLVRRQTVPPDRPLPPGCGKCDDHYNKCKKSWWCVIWPVECEESCQRDTCHFEDCHEKCGWNKC